MEQKIIGTITFSCEQNKQSLLFGTTSMSIIYSLWASFGFIGWPNSEETDCITVSLIQYGQYYQWPADPHLLGLAASIFTSPWASFGFIGWPNSEETDCITVSLIQYGQYYQWPADPHLLGLAASIFTSPWASLGFIGWPNSEETDCITASSIPYGQYYQWPADPHLLDLITYHIKSSHHGHHSVLLIDPVVRRLTASLRHRSHMDDIPSDQQILIC